jgi:hypothetical protein
LACASRFAGSWLAGFDEHGNCRCEVSIIGSEPAGNSDPDSGWVERGSL